MDSRHKDLLLYGVSRSDFIWLLLNVSSLLTHFTKVR